MSHLEVWWLYKEDGWIIELLRGFVVIFSKLKCQWQKDNGGNLTFKQEKISRLL